MASSSFPILRGPDVQQSRTQDNINGVLQPVAKALMNTPIMGAAPPAWIRPDLLNGFTDYGVGDATSGFHKDALGYVHVKGNLAAPGGGTVANTIAFVLPGGYRPKETNRFAVRGNGGVIQFLGVDPSGNVNVELAVAAGGSCSLTISFLAEQ